MSQLTKRIHTDLDEIAARAAPSPDAWLQIRERIEPAGDNRQMEVVMIETSERSTPRRRRPIVVAAAAAALIVVMAVAVILVDDGGDDQVGVAGPSDAPVTITVDGRSYVLAETEVCVRGSDDPTTGAPLVHVIGRTDDGIRVELGLNHDPDPIDPTDAAGYTGRLSIHEGSTARSWRPPVTPEPWPTLTIGPTDVTGEVTMTDQTGTDVEVTMSIRCDS